MSRVARIPELDGLRGIAIGLVLLWHLLFLPLPGARESIPWLELSWSGVDLFFVLAGFLIGGILMDHREAKNLFAVFYARRFWRIVPLYALLIGVYALWVEVLGPQASEMKGWSWLFSERPPLWVYLSLTQNLWSAWTGLWGPHAVSATWSLALEEQFYLLFPWLVRWISPRRLPIILLSLIGAAVLTRTWILDAYANGPTLVHWLLPCRWDALGLGALLAWALRDRSWGVWLRTRAKYWPWVAVVLTLGQWVLIQGRIVLFQREMVEWGYTYLAINYAAWVLVAATGSRTWGGAFLRTSWLQWLGVRAYGIFLVHMLLQGLCFGALRESAPTLESPADAGIMVLVLLLTLGVAQLSWVYFEAPLIARGHRRAYR